ncbi:MAG: sigma factor-like helix-turn-helix DNA-binding protein [Aeromonas veronii]
MRQAYALHQYGLSRQQVADQMGLSASTVAKYIKQGMIKWGAAAEQ